MNDAQHRLPVEIHRTAQARHTTAIRLRPVYVLLLTIVLVLLAFPSVNTPSAALAFPPAQDPTPTLTPEELRTQASALAREGDVLFSRSEFNSALEYYKRALSMHRLISDRAGEVIALIAIGRVYHTLGEYRKALEYYEASWPEGETRTLNNIGAIYRELGDYRRALKYSQDALSIYKATSDRSAESATLINIGVVYSRLGEYMKALEYFQEALRISREIGNRAREATALFNIGDTYVRLGEYQKALKYLQQTLSIRRAITDRAGEANALNTVGVVYSILGDYKKAVEYYLQSLAINRTIGSRVGEALGTNAIGMTFADLGEYRKSLEFFHQALVIVREIDNRTGEAYTLMNIGASHHRLGEYGNALEYCQQALAIHRAISDRSGEAVALNNMGAVYHSLSQDPKAIESYQQALAIARDINDRMTEGGTLGNIGSLYESQGELRQALDFYQQSIAVQEKVYASASIEEIKTSLAGQSADVYQRTALLHIQLKQSPQSFDLTEYARARTFLDQLGNVRPDIRKGADAQLLQQEQSLRFELAALDKNLRQERAKPRVQQSTEAIQSITAQLTKKQQEYEDILVRIKLANPEYASLVTVSPLTLSQVQKLLDKNTTLLSYFVTPDKTLAFIVTQDSFQAVELSVSEKNLSTAITGFRGFATLSDTPPSLKQLYGWLIAPLKPHLKTPVVGVITHSVLHYLPFAALTDGTRYLGDDYTLFYLPSASALPYIQQKRKETSGSVLVLAQSQAEGLPTLRYSDREAQTIAKLYNTQALLGSAATESAFRSRAGDANILHLSAHGQLNTVNSLFSRIILAPDKDADGSLEVHEVYGLDLAKADLVVLSACQTQLGAQSRGDDLIGLNRAFIYAGAPTVIASLWSVDDEATSVLMTAFYTHLKQGKGKAEALRVAQAETRAKYPHPYYWAAFVLTGDAGK